MLFFCTFGIIPEADLFVFVVVVVVVCPLSHTHAHHFHKLCTAECILFMISDLDVVNPPVVLGYIFI